MYIYNVTINIDQSVQQQWLQWMKEEHIPSMLRTGKFLNATMTRVLVEEEMGGVTYSIQYRAKDRETLERYYREDAARLRAEGRPFEGKYVAFRTELEIVSEQS